MKITEDMINRADSVLSRSRPGIPDELIRLALEAAFSETTSVFQLEWISGARPPVHPEPMTGRQGFPTFERAVRHMKNQASDAKFVSLLEHSTKIIDRSDELRAAMRAKP